MVFINVAWVLCALLVVMVLFRVVCILMEVTVPQYSVFRARRFAVLSCVIGSYDVYGSQSTAKRLVGQNREGVSG